MPMNLMVVSRLSCFALDASAQFMLASPLMGLVAHHK